jgi:hypothetical protein
MPRGLSKPRFTDPAFSKAVADALRRYKDGQNPTNKKLKNKELAGILKVSESRISRLLLEEKKLEEGVRSQTLSALSLAMALKAGVSVDYDHVELNARPCDGLGSTTQAEGTGPVPQQISFVFETGFVCENTAGGLTVRRKEPASSSAFNVQIKVG